jgi:hypothetical protein
MLKDADWISDMWGDARQTAADEMGIGVSILPETCPWPMETVLSRSG